MAALRQPALKSRQLKYWAYLTGLPMTGTKAELQALLTPATVRQKRETPSGRIVSLDMGIRNLAYCVLEPWTSKTRSDKTTLKVSAWTRKDLLDSAVSKEAGASTPAETTEPEQSTKRGRAKSIVSLHKDSFTPGELSKTACRVTKDLLSHEPSTILLERQRFRSGGAAAIQEWTVRVNMLESMLWASLETLRQEGHITAFPTVHAVSPARVAQFWSSAASTSSIPPTLFSDHNRQMQTMIDHAMSDRRKIEKKDKVDIVRSWVLGTSEIELQYEGNATRIAEAFKLNTRQSKQAMSLAGGKLDDLADCLLQAVTWLKWQQNQTVLDHLWYTTAEKLSSGDFIEHDATNPIQTYSPE